MSNFIYTAPFHAHACQSVFDIISRNCNTVKKLQKKRFLENETIDILIFLAAAGEEKKRIEGDQASPVSHSQSVLRISQGQGCFNEHH